MINVDMSAKEVMDLSSSKNFVEITSPISKDLVVGIIVEPVGVAKEVPNIVVEEAVEKVEESLSLRSGHE